MLASFQKIELVSEYVKERSKEVAQDNEAKNVDVSQLINGRRLTNIGVLRVYIEHYLSANPNINENMTTMVRQLQPTATGLPLEIYTFSKIKAWKEYEYIMADVFDHILAALPAFELEVFENPSSSDFRKLYGE